MRSRTLVIFWALVAVAVLLLGGEVSSIRAIAAGGEAVDFVLAVLSGLGLAVALFAAGRIVVHAARLLREVRALGKGG